MSSDLENTQKQDISNKTFGATEITWKTFYCTGSFKKAQTPKHNNFVIGKMQFKKRYLSCVTAWNNLTQKKFIHQDINAATKTAHIWKMKKSWDLLAAEINETYNKVFTTTLYTWATEPNCKTISDRFEYYDLKKNLKRSSFEWEESKPRNTKYHL